MNSSRIVISTVISLLLFGYCLPSGSTEAADSFQLDEMLDQSVNVLSEYLAIDTSNPPGQEVEGVRYLASLLKKENIPYRIFESAPGRANLYARLKGDGNNPAVLLLQHVDVVPTVEEQWIHPPFGGEIHEGYVWGRGAFDMKGLGVAHLMSFLALSRNEVSRDRDVVLLATADEEAGSEMGLGWFLDNHFELVEDVGLVITEGGINLGGEDGSRYVGIEVAQKLPLWIRLSVRSHSGHGSVPNGEEYSSARLVRALNRVLDYQSPWILDGTVADYFRKIAFLQPESLRAFYENPEEFVSAGKIPDMLNPAHAALLKNTVALTSLEAGSSTNVIPSVAVADLDCRLLPGQNPDRFLESLRKFVDDQSVQFDVLLRFFNTESPASPELFEAVTEVSSALHPGIRVGSSVLAGFTDAHLFRERNIPAFGFSPFSVSDSGVHSVNERIGVENFRNGVEFFYGVLAELVLTSSEPKPTQ